MLGSSITQALFASANSIAVIPKLWAEWNYNSFVQPYVVTSSSAIQIPTSYNSYNLWTTVSNGLVLSGSAITPVNKTTSSSVPVLFQINSRMANDSSSTSGRITATFSKKSTTIDGSAGKFYKFVFYVKAYDIGKNYGYPIKVNTPTAVPSTSGTSSVTYRIAGINSDNQYIQNPLALPSVTATVAQNASVTLRWTDSQVAGNTAATQISSYVIYKTIGINPTTHYLTTIKKESGLNTASYVDTNATIYANSYSPSTYTNDILISPTILAYNDSGSIVPINMFIQSTDLLTGKPSKVNGSVMASSDVWKKVEIWFGNNESSFSNIDFYLSGTAEYENAKFVTSNFELYPITEHDYYLHEYYPTESAFKPFRPGEALLHPLLPASDRVIKSNTYSASYIKPATLAVKTPQTIFSKEFVAPELAMIPSRYDKFSYYISSANERSIQARYNQNLSVNKIVLKYVNKFYKMSSGSLTLYTGSVGDSTTIALSSSDFNSNGITTLYYDGFTWSTSSWTSPPTLSSSGTFQNVINNITGITFTSPMSTTESINVVKNRLNGLSTEDAKKIHIVEISPRLEVDLSPLLISYDIRTDLTSPNSNGFPISYVNSNSGQLTLSNIPVYQTDSIGSTIFENQSPQSSFYNLLRQGVKFYGFLESPSFQQDLTEKIPQYVMYVNSWNINDFNNVSVEMFDITKTHNGMESPHFSCERSNLFDIITTLLNSIGFSDYDYDDLWQTCDSSTNTPSFWYDESKSVMDNLQDLLVSHQISASMDEYGMMRFKSLKNILQQISSLQYIPDLAITDVTRTSVGSSSLRYIPNIIPDSYTESVGDKVGKIQIKYRIPKNYNSPDNDGKNNTSNNKQWSLDSESSTKIWAEEEDFALSNFDLKSSLFKHDNFIAFDVQKNFSDPRKTITQYYGDLMIGSEIIGYSGMEYVFYPVGLSNIYLSRIIQEPSDIARCIEEIKDIYTSSGLPLAKVEYIPTGRLVGVQRGKYGTAIEDHIIATQDSINNFDRYLYSLDSASATNTSKNITINSKGMTLSTNQSNKYLMISPKNNKNYGYNLFSLDFTVPMESDKIKAKTVNNHYKRVNGKLVKDKNGTIVKKKKVNAYTDYHNLAAGIFFNLNGFAVNGTSYANATHFLEITSAQSRFGKREVSYYLNFYRIANGKKQTIMRQIRIDNVFDGQPHRISLYLNGADIAISLDGKRVTNTRKIKINQPFYNQQGSSFGAYIMAKEKNQSVSMIVNELYADKIGPDETGSIPSATEYSIENKYYFSSEYALNNIVRGFPPTKNYYLFQSVPKAYGFKIYDVKHGLSPIRPATAKILPVQYGSKAVASKTNDQANVLGPITSKDVSYSSLYSTPFMSRFAIVNNSDENVIVASSGDSESHNPLQILSNYQLLSEERIIERVIDPNYTLSIDLTTDWVASKAEAENIAKVLAKAANTFYSDINVSIFGNPLVQVGDFAEVTYGLKRIGYNPVNPSFNNTLNCMVISVEQGFTNSLADTKLVLKPVIIS